MNDNDTRRQTAEEFYATLSVEERRERIFLQPAFRDAYNEITQAHRVMQVQQYFWNQWVPVLGPVASTLYMRLRQYCYYNPETGERRDWCWPKQTTLAQQIGVKDKKTIRKALVLLEEYGFIKRERTYYKDQKSQRPHQGTDKYLIFFELPLVTEDAIELLLRQSSAAVEVKESYERKKSPHNTTPPDAPPYERKKSLHVARENIPRKRNTLSNTNNVTNVRKNLSDKTLQNHPEVVDLTPKEKASKDRLAIEIGENLKRIAGDRSIDLHKSAGFHRRVAFIMPEQLVHKALMATRDAAEDQRAGRKKIKDIGQYFGGIVRMLAQEHDIDLGIQWKGKSRVETS